MSINPFTYIDSRKAFEAHLSSWDGVTFIAIDTEFMRSDTFFPKPALLQLAVKDSVYLIDPVALKDLNLLRGLLLDDNITKVMHSCGEDLDVFSRLLGILPQPIFDTQLAAAFCGYDYSMSYQRLVGEALGQHVAKDETRSDWLQRPLSEKQKIYAAEDVAWLPALYAKLREKLLSAGREDWLFEECNRLLGQAELSNNVHVYYRRIKAASRASSRQLAVLRVLCAWRENQAREFNVPRGRIVSDSALIEMINVMPEDKYSLAALKALRPSEIRRFGSQLMQCIEEGLSCSEDKTPALLPSIRSEKDKRCYKQIKSLLGKIAQELNVPVELLGRRRDIELLIKPSSGMPSLLDEGWRKQVIGDRITPLIADSQR